MRGAAGISDGLHDVSSETLVLSTSWLSHSSTRGSMSADVSELNVTPGRRNDAGLSERESGISGTKGMSRVVQR